MLTRRWPYGTTKEVEVLAFIRTEKADVLVVQESTSGEAFKILSEGPGSHSEAQPGDLGTITFREGGPTGGHWVYTGILNAVVAKLIAMDHKSRPSKKRRPAHSRDSI